MKNKLFSFLTAATALTGIVATTSIANATTITRSASFAPDTTNIINEPLSIEKFDPLLGMLNSVTIDFKGRVEGDAGFENKDAQPAKVTVNLSGDLDLTLPDGTSMLKVSPKSETVWNASKFDKTIDFDGTSGKTLEGLNAQKSGTQTYTDTSFLQSFIGSGNLDFLFSAAATSTVSGTGNIISYVNTRAGADINVTYDYQEPAKQVPEPSELLGIGLFAGLGIFWQIKRNLKKA